MIYSNHNVTIICIYIIVIWWHIYNIALRSVYVSTSYTAEYFVVTEFTRRREDHSNYRTEVAEACVTEYNKILKSTARGPLPPRFIKYNIKQRFNNNN